jgi:hypothetical protein
MAEGTQAEGCNWRVYRITGNKGGMDMTESRATATNQFSTVIDALQLGKKTGILTVERGEGETFEKGVIAFANGDVVNAILGSYQGRDAATKLFSWQACRFSFVSMPSQQIAANQEGPCGPAEPAGAGVADKRLPSKADLTHPDARDSLSRRPFPAADALDTVLASLDRQGFTRVHRRLFLLIDGKRSTEELAMLVGRPSDEIIALLADLERAGFIRL